MSPPPPGESQAAVYRDRVLDQLAARGFDIRGQIDVEKVLTAIQGDPCGKDATVIGEVVADHPGKVFMKTRIGGIRIVDMLTGEQLPRIC